MNLHDKIREYAESHDLELLENEDGDIALSVEASELYPPDPDDFHSAEAWSKWIDEGQAFVWTC